MGKNVSGFTVLESLVALGVSAIAALGILSAMQSGQEQIQNLEIRLERLGLKTQITQALSTTDGCTATVRAREGSNIRMLATGAGNSLSSPVSFVNPDLELRFAGQALRSGDVYGSKRIAISSIRFQGYTVTSAAEREVSASLVVQTDPHTPGSRRVPATIEIPIVARVSPSGMMEWCHFAQAHRVETPALLNSTGGQNPNVETPLSSNFQLVDLVSTSVTLPGAAGPANLAIVDHLESGAYVLESYSTQQCGQISDSSGVSGPSSFSGTALEQITGLNAGGGLVGVRPLLIVNGGTCLGQGGTTGATARGLVCVPSVGVSSRRLILRNPGRVLMGYRVSSTCS